jgi:hypothetical protein
MSPRASRRALPRIAFALIALTSLTASVPPVAATPTGVVEIAAVGDIACQSFSQSDGEGACRSDEVAALITDLDPDAFFALGDLQYNNGKLEEFLRVYDPQFGHLNPSRIRRPGTTSTARPGRRGISTTSGSARTGRRATTPSTWAPGTSSR